MERYRLYWAKGSGAYPAAVVLEAAGAPWEGVELTLAAGDSHKPEYLALNPAGQVPTLVLPDGTVMTESAAMAWHLADSLPAAGLLPPAGHSARPRLLRWLIFAATALYEDDLRYYYPERYTADPAGVPGVKAAGAAAFDRHFAMVAAELEPGPFLLGSGMTVVDLYLAMLATWHPGRPAAYERLPALPRLVAAVKADARAAPLWERFAMES